MTIRLDDAKKHLADSEQALAALQRQIQRVREDMKETHQLFLDKHLTAQGFADLYNPGEQRLNQLMAELPKLEADVARLKVDQVSVEEVVFEARNLYEQWPKMEVEKKRTIVEAIFEKIEIGEGKINITYSGLPSSEELCKNQQQMAPATSMRRQSRGLLHYLAAHDFISGWLRLWQDRKGSRFHPNSLSPAVHDWIRVLTKSAGGPSC